MFVWVCFGEGLCAWKRGYNFCHFSPRCCLWLRFEMECHVVDGEWWRMWALTCWGHRRCGTESINGVTGSERRWADVIAMCAGGIVLQSDHADLTPDLITHWDVFEKQIVWPFLLAVSVGLTQILLHLSLKRTSVHTLRAWMTTHRLTCTVHPSALKKGKGGRWVKCGGGEVAEISHPLCAQWQWRAGQRKDGGTKGARDGGVRWF